MLRKILGRFFPYVLASAWLVTAGYTVTSLGALGAASEQLASADRARPPGPGCDCVA